MQYIILDYGIKNVGHFALRCLRIEKFIPFWGEEITGDTTPNEVNRAYKVKFDKQYFIGKFESCFQRAAKPFSLVEIFMSIISLFLFYIGKTGLLDQRNKGITKRLVQFHLEAFDSEIEMWPGGGEAIHRNGEYVG